MVWPLGPGISNRTKSIQDGTGFHAVKVTTIPLGQAKIPPNEHHLHQL